MSPEKKATIEAFGKAIARQLSARRAHQALTQSELSEATGISQSQLSKQLRGLRAINMDELDLLCKALGISMGRLIKLAEQELSDQARSNPSNIPSPDVAADPYADGAVPNWEEVAHLPHAADSSPEETEARLERGEDPID